MSKDDAKRSGAGFSNFGAFGRLGGRQEEKSSDSAKEGNRNSLSSLPISDNKFREENAAQPTAGQASSWLPSGAEGEYPDLTISLEPARENNLETLQEYMWREYFLSEKSSAPVQKSPPAQKSVKVVKRQKAEKAAKEQPENNSVRVTGCPANAPKKFSIQFQVKDANGKPCEGMYYSVFIKDHHNLRDRLIINNKGEAENELGKTEVFYCDTQSEVYLYIGHRQENWLTVPGVKQEYGRNPPANAGDEAPLKMEMMDLAEKCKLVPAPTKRLWKPWIPSPQLEEFQLEQEQIIYNPYLDYGNHGNVTVGAGHLIHNGGFVLDDTKIDRVIADLQRQSKTVTKASIKADLESVLKLDTTRPKNKKGKEIWGSELDKGQAEVDFIGTLSLDGKGGVMDIYHKDRKYNASLIPHDIHVPLYQHEYDALVDLCFNGGIGALRASGIVTVLNHGLYSEVPQKIDGYGFHRKPQQKGIWSHNHYEKKPLVKENYKSKPHGEGYYTRGWTPRNDIK